MKNDWKRKRTSKTVKTSVLLFTSLSISHSAFGRKRNDKFYLMAKGLRPGPNIGGNII
jgi:hypothetical protein